MGFLYKNLERGIKYQFDLATVRAIGCSSFLEFTVLKFDKIYFISLKSTQSKKMNRSV